MEALFDPTPVTRAVAAPVDLDRDALAARARLLSGLNPAQAAAVTSSADALRIIAGAGSGKTRVLTRRIARRVVEGEIDPRRVLAVTFTRKAAAELRHRFTQLGLRGDINAGTFHAVAYTQLRQRWQERNVTPPELLDRKVGFVGRLVRAKSSTLALDVVGEIEWAKARMISAGDYPALAEAAGRRPPIDLGHVADLYARYEEAKLAARMVDFDDLLRLATRDIEADGDYAAARRWRHRHLFVDEFQDVNPLQFRLLQAWVGPTVDLCVVGDPNQAIYAWNGADSRFLDEFDSLIPGSSTVELTENYRSSPQILGLANTVLNQTPSRRFTLTPNRPSGPMPTVRSYPDEVAEARGIARAARDRHHPGALWSDQAVLVRTNAQLTILEEAFSASSVPFRSRGGTRLLDQPEIKDLLREFRRGGGSLTVRLSDLDGALAAASEPAETDRPETAAASTPEPDFESRPSAPQGSGPLAMLTAERLANVGELVRLGREYLDFDPEGSSEAFVSWVTSALRNENGSANGNDAVDLVTFHAAKGLEWPVVHLAGLEEGLVPIHFATTAEASAEEIRLIYVALTRAERELSLSWAERRSFGSRELKRKPSPFLETIGIAIDLMTKDAGAVDLDAAVAAVVAQRTKLAADNGVGRAGARRGSKNGDDLSASDTALLDRLKVWRRDHARAANAPAFVIFNDATLIEVARTRPTDHRQLLAVAGIGAVKAQRFGPELLALVADAD